MIKLYDWYKDAKGRIWCVVRIWPTCSIGDCSVDILEMGKVSPVNQPEKIILELINNGSFKKYIIN